MSRGAEVARKHRDREHDLMLGHRIRQLRAAAEIGQGDLAAAIGVSKQQLSKYEVGRDQVSSAMVLKLCRALRCDPNTLLNWDETGPG